MEGGTAFRQWFDEQVKQIEKILDSGKPFAGEIEELKNQLLTQVCIENYISRIRGLLADGFTGRQWVFEEMQNWLDTDSGRKIFCINGERDYGKSTLTAQFAIQNKILMGGIHFCSAKSFLDTPVILSLAFQLGTRLPAYRKYLLRHQFDLNKLSDDDLFVKLISEAGNFGIDGGRMPCLPVIDGLDEAPG